MFYLFDVDGPVSNGLFNSSKITQLKKKKKLRATWDGLPEDVEN